VDPDIRNEASMRLFQKCGFIEHKQIDTKDALKQPVTLQLLMKKREKFSVPS
jgi:RimJ/RimL family protein N-acetyltransferase